MADGRSRVNGDIHARFWESAGVRFPRATHLSRCQLAGVRAWPQEPWRHHGLGSEDATPSAWTPPPRVGGTRPSRRFAKSGDKDSSGSQGIAYRASLKTFFFSTSARSELAQRAPRPTVSKSRRRTGGRFAPHEPGRPSNTPAHRVPQNRQWPSSVRFQSLKTYQSRPMSFSPQ